MGKLTKRRLPWSTEGGLDWTPCPDIILC